MRDEFVFAPAPAPSVAIEGGGRFPVRRIFCIGRNYADHVREMGGDPKASPPVFFAKPADAVTPSGAVIPFPQGTADLHYEGELVVALKGGGRDIQTEQEAASCVFGLAAGCDLTRRDLQAAAKKAGGPWDAAKGFDASAPVGAIRRIAAFPPEGFAQMRLVLAVNGAARQDALLGAMIWSVPEIIMALSRLFELKAGDLIFTGTPEGVGALHAGDRVALRIGALPPLDFAIA